MKKKINKSFEIWKDFFKNQTKNKVNNFTSDISEKIFMEISKKGYSKINIYDLENNSSSEELKNFFSKTKKNFFDFLNEINNFDDHINKDSRKSDYQIRAFGSQHYSKFDKDFKSINELLIIKEILNNFFGIDTINFQNDFWISFKNKSLEKRQASQRWHSDPEFHKVIKIFFYFDDVSENTGPTEYIKGSFLSFSLKQFFLRLYNFPHISAYYPEWLIKILFSKKQVFKSIGKEGDIFFYNTTGLHRGGYVNEGIRKLAIFSFTNKKSPYLKESYI